MKSIHVRRQLSLIMDLRLKAFAEYQETDGENFDKSVPAAIAKCKPLDIAEQKFLQDAGKAIIKTLKEEKDFLKPINIISRLDKWLNAEFKKHDIYAMKVTANKILPNVLQANPYMCHSFVNNMIDEAQKNEKNGIWEDKRGNKDLDSMKNLSKKHPISLSEVKPGDVVCYYSSAGLEHSALIVGKNAAGTLIAVSKFGYTVEYLHFHPIDLVLDHYGDERRFSRPNSTPAPQSKLQELCKTIYPQPKPQIKSDIFKNQTAAPPASVPKETATATLK